MKSLKEHRQDQYLSVRDLAASAQVSPDTVWRIENGEYQFLRPKTMRAIAAALNVHPSEIGEFARKHTDTEENTVN